MALLTTLPIRITASGVIVETGNFSLRVSPFGTGNKTSVGVYSGEDGIWNFKDLYGDVKLYNDDTNTEISSFTGGGAQVYRVFDGDISASQIDTGTLDVARLPTGIPAINIGAGAVSNTEFGYLDGVTSAIQTQLNSLSTGKANLSGGNAFYGMQIFDVGVAGATYPRAYYNGESPAYVAPISAFDLTPKQYVDTLVSNAINNASIAMSSKVRWVIPGAATVENKIYGTIAGAVASCTSPTAANRYTIIVWDSGTTYLNLPHSAIVDYVDIVSMNPNINLLVGANGETATETSNMSITGFNLYYGEGAGATITTDRTYNNIRFTKCLHYIYRDITFGGSGALEYCEIVQASGDNPTITGTLKLMYSDSAQDFVFNTHTGTIKGVPTGGSDPSVTLPPDPTAGA